MADPFQKCIAITAVGVDAIQSGKFLVAETAFKAALTEVPNCTPQQAAGLASIIRLNQSFILSKQGKLEEAEQLRAQSSAHLNDLPELSESRGFHYLVAVSLQKLSDYQRAIPFWQRAIELAESEVEADRIASMLQKLGECYSRIGLKDHAVVPLRAALRLFEHAHEDPRRAAALITLGNALRESAPAEAEASYKEAAEMFASRLQYEAAAPAWGNLGILCSRQGRHEEALEYHQKVLRIRQNSASPQLAITLNNIAACYMRMGRHAEAHDSVDRALQLKPSGESLASALCTKGMVHQSAGEYAEAVVWFRRSNTERETHPSPNFEGMVDDLNREIDSLTQLGRSEEADATKAALAKVRARMSAVAQPNIATNIAGPPLDGAVTIEISDTDRPNRRSDTVDFKKLKLALMYDAEEDNTGHLSAAISVPGCITLIFYGDDAEALFHALQPRLEASPLLGGALVTIRQHDQKRQVVLPGRAAPVN